PFPPRPSPPRPSPLAGSRISPFTPGGFLLSAGEGWRARNAVPGQSLEASLFAPLPSAGSLPHAREGACGRPDGGGASAREAACSRRGRGGGPRNAVAGQSLEPSLFTPLPRAGSLPHVREGSCSRRERGEILLSAGWGRGGRCVA